MNFYQRIDAGSPTPVEITEEEYYDALEVLPPIYIEGKKDVSCFAMMEPLRHTAKNEPVYYCFARLHGKYYGVISILAKARQKFGEFSVAEVTA